MTGLYLLAAFLAAFAAVLWIVKRWGRAEAQKETAARAVSHASESHAIDEAVARLDDRTLDQRLRNAGE
jgi:hypothetical protein